MKEHLIQLRIQSKMDLETLIKNFPPNLLVRSAEEPNAKGHSPLEVIYIKEIKSAPIPNS